MNLSDKNIGGFYALLFGLPFSLLLSYIILEPTLIADLFQEIAYFGIEATPIFWGIIYPLIYLAILFIAGRQINTTEQKSLFQKASKFSFSVTLKIIAILSFLFLGNKLLNGISTTVIPIHSLIFYSITILLFIIFTSAIITFIISLSTVKLIDSKSKKKALRNSTIKSYVSENKMSD